MFDVIMYLFDSYFLDENAQGVDSNEIQKELLKEGFTRSDITKAMNWFEHLEKVYESKIDCQLDQPKKTSHRIYHSLEKEKISTECRGFLIYLEEAGILRVASREVIIECMMQLDDEELGLLDFQWLILMVLGQDPTENDAFLQLESMLFDFESGLIH
jgi:Smg protein